MTPDQQKLFDDHIKITYNYSNYLCRYLGVPFSDFKTHKNTALIALWKACLTWDEKKATSRFTSYLYIKVKQTIIDTMRRGDGSFHGLTRYDAKRNFIFHSIHSTDDGKRMMIENLKTKLEQENNDIRDALETALAAMRHRKAAQVLKLYFFDGLTLKEIAVILDTSESRVCQIVSLGLNSLRGRLDLNDFLKG